MVMNITFRKISPNDLEFINNVRNTYAGEYLHDSRTFKLSETVNWYNSTNPDFWMIVVDALVVGYFRLSNHSTQNSTIYIGADIAPEYVGRGFAKRAYQQFIPFLFEQYNLNKITLEVLSTNTRAINLYKKLGFLQEGTKRQEVLKNEIYVDSIIMSILKQDYYANILEDK